MVGYPPEVGAPSWLVVNEIGHTATTIDVSLRVHTRPQLDLSEEVFADEAPVTTEDGVTEDEAPSGEPTAPQLPDAAEETPAAEAWAGATSENQP